MVDLCLICGWLIGKVHYIDFAIHDLKFKSYISHSLPELSKYIKFWPASYPLQCVQSSRSFKVLACLLTPYGVCSHPNYTKFWPASYPLQCVQSSQFRRYHQQADISIVCMAAPPFVLIGINLQLGYFQQKLWLLVATQIILMMPTFRSHRDKPAAWNISKRSLGNKLSSGHVNHFNDAHLSFSSG